MITLYSKPNCPYCEAAKSWLAQQSIQFVAVDVSRDDRALDFLRAEGHRTVPQIYRGDQIAVPGGYTGLTKLRETAVEQLRQIA